MVDVISIGALLSFALAPLAASQAAPGGRICGKLIDVTGDVLPGASVRVRQAEPARIVTRAGGSETGDFETGIVAGGSYTVTIRVAGLRGRTVENVVVREGEQDVDRKTGRRVVKD